MLNPIEKRRNYIIGAIIFVAVVAVLVLCYLVLQLSNEKIPSSSVFVEAFKPKLLSSFN